MKEQVKSSLIPGPPLDFCHFRIIVECYCLCLRYMPERAVAQRHVGRTRVKLGLLGVMEIHVSHLL